jgi:formamidopyrimidine-DNA glycosylase
MPELPEVETVVRGLQPVMEGQAVAGVDVRRPDLRIPIPKDFARRIAGQQVATVRRRAKYILIGLESGDTAMAHLGMSGRIFIEKDSPPAPSKHDHIVFTMADGTQIRLNDPRRFGLVEIDRTDALDDHRFFAKLGPDPTGNAFNGPALAQALKSKKCSIKAALLDQRVVAGLGNIYISEALFESGISPKRLAGTVQGGRAEKLAHAVQQVLAKAIAAGGSSLRDYVQPSGELGYFQHQWAVYGREGEACPTCDCDVAVTGGVQRFVQSNRSTFYCSRRQR